MLGQDARIRCLVSLILVWQEPGRPAVNPATRVRVWRTRACNARWEFRLLWGEAPYAASMMGPNGSRGLAEWEWPTSPQSYWQASEASETLSGLYKFVLVRYIYVWRYVCRMPRIRNVGGVRPLPFFIRASSFKRSNY